MNGRFRTRGPNDRARAAPSIADIDARDRISLAAGAFALLGVILLAVGVLMPEVIVLLAGLAAFAGGTGTLAGQHQSR